MAFLRPVERVEVASVERRDDRVGEDGKQVAQPEGEPPAGLQQVIGKGRRIVPLGAHDDFEAGALAPVPAGPEPRLVVEAERDGLFEGDDLETPLADGFEERGFEQQAIGIGRHGQARDPRRERLQDPVAPVRHRTGPWPLGAAPKCSVARSGRGCAPGIADVGGMSGVHHGAGNRRNPWRAKSSSSASASASP